jgi:hypothetical protein
MNHAESLRAAGTDHVAFHAAFAGLKTSKLRVAEIAQIARDYADIPNRRMTKTEAYREIEKAYIRRARFEAKIA